MNPRDHLLKKYNIKTDLIEIPNAGRDELADFFHDLNFKKGAEIGVAAGEYSEIIMQRNPQLQKMYGIDQHFPYKGYTDYTKLGTYNSLEQKAHARLDKYSNYQFIKKLSMDALADFADDSLDFVYIDANHSEPYVSQDIAGWANKVRSGGIVSGHDYARIKGRDGQDSANWAVIDAIGKYAEQHGYQLFVWGLQAKIPGLKRDASRSWMFVRK